jgi:hypothetical protein
MAVSLNLVSSVLAGFALVFALAMTAVSYRTYRQERTRRYRHVFVGFVFLTGGVLIEEVMLWTAAAPLHVIHGFEAALFLVGFGFLFMSLR